jgi:hypothetical protein
VSPDLQESSVVNPYILLRKTQLGVHYSLVIISPLIPLIQSAKNVKSSDDIPDGVQDNSSMAQSDATKGTILLFWTRWAMNIPSSQLSVSVE